MAYSPADNRYEAMKYRRSGESGLFLPEVSLGLWHSFGNIDNFKTQQKLLRRAFDLGITHFDLANNYGPPYGSAESNFGKHFERDFKRHRDELVISTKAGYDMWPGPYGEWGSRKYLLTSLDQSLKRMGIPYVDIFYSHRFDPNTPLEETMGALASAVHQGKALYVGISSYNSEQTLRAKAILADHKVPLLIHQPRYSMLDRTPENGLLSTLSAEGVGCITFSPLAQGLLSDKYLRGSVPKKSRAARSKYLKPEIINTSYLEIVRELNEMAVSRGQTLAQFAISWILRQNTVSSVLIGASSVKQLEENVKAISSPAFSAAELHQIDRVTSARSVL